MRKFLKISLILFMIPLFGKGEDRSYAYARLFADPAAVSGQIKSKLDELSVIPGTRIGGEKFHNIEYVTNLYHRSDYQPLWTSYHFTEDAIMALLGSYDDGLIPLDYHLEAILVIRNHLTLDTIVTEDKIRQAAGLELLITDGIILYADHLLYGKIDPVTLNPTWNFGYSPIPEITPYTFREIILNREIISRLHDLKPEALLYDTLASTLKRYREIETRGGWPVVPVGSKIEPGKTDNRIPMVRKRLKMIGLLTSTEDSLSTLYDKNLEKDVRLFQSMHGLDPDGVIGAGTFREMNVPVSDRIATLRINMERARWVGHNLPENFLIVNIAAFWLMLVEKGQLVYTSNVVVGKTYRKTPVFRDKMRYIELNPTWTMPRSIIKSDIIPKLKKDPEYLAKNNMKLLDSKGNEVPATVLDIPNLTIGKFPYLVRQQPGPDNSLGVVKFMFPNEYDVYLHDTPSKNLFTKPSRAYSSGCIRVDKPLDLAEKLLAGTAWDRAKIDRTVKSNQTTRVNLPEPLDILILYWTCGLNPERKLFFAPDIYSRDQDVLKELDRLLR